MSKLESLTAERDELACRLVELRHDLRKAAMLRDAAACAAIKAEIRAAKDAWSVLCRDVAEMNRAASQPKRSWVRTIFPIG
jgi:hypothetical protein